MNGKILTEDDVIVEAGTRVYNYYDMKPGVIESINHQYGTGNPNIKEDIWFFVAHDDGSRALLNGARICTIAFAQRRGFKDAA